MSSKRDGRTATRAIFPLSVADCSETNDRRSEEFVAIYANRTGFSSAPDCQLFSFVMPTKTPWVGIITGFRGSIDNSPGGNCMGQSECLQVFRIYRPSREAVW